MNASLSASPPWEAQALWCFSYAVRKLDPTPAPADEVALIAAASKGDGRAFDALYRRHVQLVFARLTRLLGPSPEREDLVQQVFLELHRALPSFRGEAPLGAFVHAITVRVGYDFLRRRARSKSAMLRDEQFAELVAPGSSPEAAARERQELALAFARLDALKPKKRLAFVLHVVEGFSLEHMARMLDTDARTLGQRVAHARRELAVMYQREQLRAQAKGGQ
jgi:RNA polymerase sigma-70 factor (ECF subfamily)